MVCEHRPLTYIQTGMKYFQKERPITCFDFMLKDSWLSACFFNPNDTLPHTCGIRFLIAWPVSVKPRLTKAAHTKILEKTQKVQDSRENTRRETTMLQNTQVLFLFAMIFCLLVLRPTARTALGVRCNYMP